MWSLLRSRRWLGFTALVVGAVVAFGLLSLWQWHRAEDKRAQRSSLEAAFTQAPIPLSSLATPDRALAAADEWRHVSAAGTYDAADQVLVRRRPLDARNGFWVMTPLRGQDGTTVWVNRGWLAASGDALSTPDVPIPPAGTVEVTGFARMLEPGDAGSGAGLPAGQIPAASAAALPAQQGQVVAYLQLEDSAPAQTGLVALPVPEVDEGRNISYAVQWLIFAAVAIGGWFFFLRREAREDAAAGASDEREGSGAWT